MRTALIRHGAAEHFSDTVFTLQVLRNSARPRRRCFQFFPSRPMHDERLGPVIWLQLSPIFGGLQNPRLALYERDLDLPRVGDALIAKLASTIAAILAVIVSGWSSPASSSNPSWSRWLRLEPRWRPRSSLNSWRELLRFSGWLTGSYTLDNVSYGRDNMIVGGFLGIRMAGSTMWASSSPTCRSGSFCPSLTGRYFRAPAVC
ncbi:MAG: oligosaccharide flippase family protein [Alphaproteobacteria bacterium]